MALVYLKPTIALANPSSYVKLIDFSAAPYPRSMFVATQWSVYEFFRTPCPWSSINRRQCAKRHSMASCVLILVAKDQKFANLVRIASISRGKWYTSDTRGPWMARSSKLVVFWATCRWILSIAAILCTCLENLHPSSSAILRIVKAQRVSSSTVNEQNFILEFVKAHVQCSVGHKFGEHPRWIIRMCPSL